MLRLSITLLLALCACSARAEVTVLASLKPLQLIAAAVQEGVGQPDVLLPPGASPHQYALRPSDVRRIREATLVYWIGPGLETFLPQLLDGRQGASVPLQSLPGLHLRHFPDDDGELDARDEHDHDHRPGTLDAHLWLAPKNARVIAARMTADLVVADPDNAARYRSNLVAFEHRLVLLDQRLREQLKGISGKPYFVFHEAYDYFEATYGIRHAGVFSVLGEVQPGARHVADMRQRLQQAGPSCVFSEPPLQPRLAQTLIEGLPVKLAELDALGSNVPVTANGYEQLLEQLASRLTECLATP